MLRAELTILDRFWSGPPGRGGPAGGVVLTLWIAPLRGVRETTVVADPLGGSIPPRRARRTVTGATARRAEPPTNERELPAHRPHDCKKADHLQRSPA